MSDLRKKLKMESKRFDEVNAFLMDPDNEMINKLLAVIEKYGTIEEINRMHEESDSLEYYMARLEEKKSPYVADLKWLMEQRDNKAFISKADYMKKHLGDKAEGMVLDATNAVTLEISAVNFFPWLIAHAKMAIEKEQMMPGRFIRVRFMKEQEGDDDLLAVRAGLKIVGASCVETLDTKGTDGSNIMLGGPDTLSGYFGGIGSPNDYPYKWVDEYLYYYTKYGVTQVLNTNPGTVLMGYLMHKLGINNEFKVSVFMGNDNPLAAFWTLMAAKLFSREDGKTSLIGFNFSNSVNAETIRASNAIREAFDLTENVRFEHHITETYKSIVIQPYQRLDELLDLATDVPNISAKHEGGDPDREVTREHPSNILEYFIPKEDIIKQGMMEKLELNYLDKQDSLDNTAAALVKKGIDFVCAKNLH
jgi:bifunctional DNA-binding transcriptional regulator/antitoxin component of YhaV-PrlF toxin-antitoxin module